MRWYKKLGIILINGLNQKLNESGLNGWYYMKLKDMERAPRVIKMLEKEV